MPRGRPSLHEEPVTWHVSIPGPIAAEVELLLYDPMLGKVAYGKRGELVAQLLAEWLEARKAAGQAQSQKGVVNE